MKKAFTLAEVLITLVIIGIIAAITIPSLVQKTENHQYISAYLKMYSSICQVYNRAKADNGGFWGLNLNSTNDYPAVLQKYFAGSKVCLSGQTTGNCWHEKWYNGNGSPVRSTENTFASLILNDGSIILFLHMSSECTGSTELNTNTGCARFRTDINGFRGPNRVGKDIFDFYILADRVIARGDPLSNTSIDNTSGWGKGYKILITGEL